MCKTKNPDFFHSTTHPLMARKPHGQGILPTRSAKHSVSKGFGASRPLPGFFANPAPSLQALFLLAFSGSLQKRQNRKKILLQSKTVYICRTLKFKKNYHEQS